MPAGGKKIIPASIKTVAEWFPSKERALATGIFNAGTNIGAILTPLIVLWINIHWGFRCDRRSRFCLNQGFSANLFTPTSDLFPTQVVASVVGIGGWLAQSEEC
jgi:sugar phosphate permease